MDIYGYELPEFYYKKFCRAIFRQEDLEKAIGRPDPTKFNILLAHNPIYFDSYAWWGRGSDRIRSSARRYHKDSGHRRNHHAPGEIISQV